MKRQRIRTKFFVVELQGGNGNAGQAELSNKEESADELAESDSESEQLLVSSPHRKSSKKSHHKRARNETPNSDDESEEWTFTSILRRRSGRSLIPSFCSACRLCSTCLHFSIP